MMKVTLPPINGTYSQMTTRSLPAGYGNYESGSRPSSSGSNASSYSNHNSLYDKCAFTRAPSRANTFGSRHTLPSLRNNRARQQHSHIGHSKSEINARFSAKYRSSSERRRSIVADSPFLNKTETDDCLKCLLKVPHKRCESHKYIRVGGGYRHGYWYVKCLLEELELQRQRELIMKQRLEAIRETNVKAIKTYIRTKSGRLVEKIIFLSEEDYEAFKQGKNVEELLKKYLTKDEAKGLESWDKDEVKAIKTYVRTKSGRLIEKLVYVSKEDYDAIIAGGGDAKELLKKYAKDGETIEGWEEAKMKTIKTYVRTKSGRIIEKLIQISQEDYDAMIRDGKNADEILKKYLTLEDGQQLDSWKSAEPMKAIKTMVRTKSGRLIEKTIFVSAEDYDKMIKGGGDPNEILKKYMDGEDVTIESWKKVEGNPMKVVKTMVRTKSGRLIEKTIMLTEEEYKKFIESGGDPEFLKKFIPLDPGEVIESWEKASTVYDGGEDHGLDLTNAKHGQRLVGKDGAVYEVFVDPLTGKKYTKKIESDVDSGIASMNKKGKKGRKGGKGGDDDIEETAEERRDRKQGKRDPDSDSEYSYKSHRSAGGTRHVVRRRKRADGTYSDPESYHSSQDEDGQARRRRRRRERKHGPDSAHSYYSVVSDGGTRHVRRRRKRPDGTYSGSESYHSEDSLKEGGRLADKKKKKKRREHGSDSEHSYYSEVSEGGTRTRKRKKRIRDEHGNVIGYGDAEEYHSDDSSVYTTVSDGKGGKMIVKKKGGKGGKDGKGGGKDGKGGKGKKKLEPAFSDVTTSDDDVDLENMTEEEKKAYFEAKAKRAAERERRRREKYGDKYDEMMEKHKEYKKQKEKEKMKQKKLEELRAAGVISQSSNWTIDSDTGEPMRKSEKAEIQKEKEKQKKLQELREKGLISPSSDWTLDSEGEPARRSELIKQGKRDPNDPRNKKKGRRGGGGDESEYESETESYIDPLTGERKVRKVKDSQGYEYEYDDQGRVIRKFKRGKGGDDDAGSEYEYQYDSDGNMKIVKKKGKGKKGGDGDDSDEEQFEVGPDGKVRLKPGKKKINIDKLTDEDLRKLGIDPTLSKEEIARQLKEKFGDDVDVFIGDKKIPTKRASEYGSDVGSSQLAADSDLDVDTLTGPRRVNVKMKKGGKELLDHMKSIIENADLKTADGAKDLDERGDIDFVAHYRLVDPNKVEGYARAFVVEDDDRDQVLNYKESRIALNGLPTVQAMSDKQLEYVLKVLNIDDASQVTFRMFAVITALCERVTQMDPLCKHLIEICDLLDIQRKMALYKAMFYCNIESDRDANFIKADSLRIELIAGGLNWKQQEHVMGRLQPNIWNEISFLDYLVYVPLFLSMHDNIVDNPLDMSSDKYNSRMRQLSGGNRQRDMNPLGQPLKKTSTFQMRKQAQDLIEGKIDPKKMKEEKVEQLNKYAKLPEILSNESKAPAKNSAKPPESPTVPMIF